MKLNILNLVIKITRKCNATCTHCSASSNQDVFISIDNIKKIIDKVAKYINLNKAYFLFHGGEPMLMGPEYYYKLYEYITNNYPNKFIFSMQSNFLLYNDEWQDIFNKYNVIASSSYDFFSDIRNIKGDVKLYYDIWYKNIKTFQEKTASYKKIEYYYPYIINIVNKQNVDKAKEIYEIGKKEKFNLRHNYYWKVRRGDKNSEKYYLDVEYYTKFVLETLEYYVKDIKSGEKIKNVIYPIHYFLNKITNPNYDFQCPWINNCAGSNILIDDNGKMFTCHTFSDIDKYSFGNIFEINDLIEITKHKNFRKLYQRRIKLPMECLSCKYFKYCQGGCMRDSYINDQNFGDIYGKTWACHAWYNIIDRLMEYKEILK